MEEQLKQELGTCVLKKVGNGVGGCISEAQTFQTDSELVFVKFNTKSEARRMFDGEFASLLKLNEAREVRVPKPIKVIQNSQWGAALVLEHIDIGGLSSKASVLGQQLANLHKKNKEVGNKVAKDETSIHRESELSPVDKFGFDVPTCCGYLPQCNTWTDTWTQFYSNKIEEQICRLEKEYGDRCARDLWSQLLPSMPRFFDGLDLYPALLHGDLWCGNVGQDANGPVIFDPASFYGHSEFDLSISQLFGGFGSSFFSSYFKVLPKQPGYDTRLTLYQLFHNLNHWNHFGGSYKNASLGMLQSLVKMKKS